MRKHTPNDNPLWEDLFKGGSLRRVTRWGESVLHAQTRPVTEFDEDLTCLLYTSPSPRDGLLSRMPSSA